MSYKKLKAKFPGTCRNCQKKIEVGQTVYWDKSSKEIVHKTCFEKKTLVRGSSTARRTSLTYPFAGSYRNGRGK